MGMSQFLVPHLFLTAKHTYTLSHTHTSPRVLDTGIALGATYLEVTQWEPKCRLIRSLMGWAECRRGGASQGVWEPYGLMVPLILVS